MTHPPCVSCCAPRDAEPDPLELPLEDDEWEEFDLTPLDAWILDDFDWDIEEPHPAHGDFSDDLEPPGETDE